MKALKPILAFVLVAACLFGLNIVTAPKIAENASASLLGPLANVLPGAGNLVEEDLADLPETVSAIYKDEGGAGYSVKLSTTQGYTKEAIEAALGVSSDGKITGLEITEFPDTKEVSEDFIASFTDKDSALDGVDLVAGVTFSSSAIKNAVSDALNYMADNGMITAGVKGDAQILKELLPQVFPGMANAQGILQLTEDSTDEMMLAANGSGPAAIFADGDSTYLQICNVNGNVKTFDVNGAEVDAAAVTDTSIVSTADADKARIEALAGDGAKVEEIPLEGVFNCVTSAFKVNDNMYGFGVRPYAYANEVMPIYFIIDGNGAIVKMTAPELILHGEYFTSYTLDAPSYKEGFVGKTADTFTDETALISGATMSSDAVSMATKAAFAAYEILKGGEAA